VTSFALFFRKGKTRPLDILVKDKTGSYINFFTSIGEEDSNVDWDVASEFVCRIYSQHKTKDVNYARYNKMVELTGKYDKVISLSFLHYINAVLVHILILLF
jgi:hypothetical protein